MILKDLMLAIWKVYFQKKNTDASKKLNENPNVVYNEAKLGLSEPRESLEDKKLIDISQNEKKNPELNHLLPEIKSPANSNDITSECKSNGERSDEEINEKLSKYRIVKILGIGSTGSVFKLIRKADEQVFALKMIETNLLNTTEKRLLENEVSIYKDLSGPTIIKFYDSFTGNDHIFIIMEYADEGNLSSKIEKAKKEKMNFSTDQVLYWIAQITIAILIMHSNKFIHKDIKTQNIFISKNILKIGDFGISKQMKYFNEKTSTSCGTPSILSPQIVKGEPYDQKSDMWALGCLIYELVTFKMPFDGVDENELHFKIINENYESLPTETDAIFNLLISGLLEKDCSKRLSIWQFANIPIITEKIKEFAEKNKCQDIVKSVININFTHSKNEEEEGFPTSNEEQTIILESVFDYCETLKKNVKLLEYKVGWFSNVKGCMTGKEIIDYFTKQEKFTEKNAIDIIETMIEEKLIFEISSKSKKSQIENGIYQFSVGRNDQPANLPKTIYVQNTGNAILVSIRLAETMKAILEKSKFKNELNKTQINCENALKLKAFSKYLLLASELSQVDISALLQKMKLLFFLNVYQSMFMHYVIKGYKGNQTDKSKVKYLKKLIIIKETKFEYKIARQNFSLDIIKHVILRGNKKPNNSYFKLVKDSDPIAKILNLDEDPRILFVLKDYPEIPENIYVFKNVNTLKNDLKQMVGIFLSSTIKYYAESGTLILPKLFSTYKYDFGKTESDIIGWISENSSGQIKKTIDELRSNTKNQTVTILYNDNDPK